VVHAETLPDNAGKKKAQRQDLTRLLPCFPEEVKEGHIDSQKGSRRDKTAACGR
jgi:hypothetical protein